MLNIVHVHLNDMGDEATVEVDYMTEGQKIEDFHKFDLDISGRPLRYKIIVADMKISCILYNTGKSVEQVPFEELRRNVGDFVTFND